MYPPQAEHLWFQQKQHKLRGEHQPGRQLESGLFTRDFLSSSTAHNTGVAGWWLKPSDSTGHQPSLCSGTTGKVSGEHGILCMYTSCGSCIKFTRKVCALYWERHWKHNKES